MDAATFLDNFSYLAEAPNGVEKLREMVLDLAIRGKLVEKVADDEPVSELMNRISAQRNEAIAIGHAKKRKRFDPLRRDDLNHTVPAHWEITRLDELIAFDPSNGISPKPSGQETATKSLTLSATTRGVFDPRHVKYLDEEFEKSSPLWLREGDILIQRSNTDQYVGVSAVYHGADHDFIYPDLMMKVRIVEALDVDFIHVMLSVPSSRDYWRQRASGTSGSMKKINQTTVCSMPIPIPPLAEQKRIVAKVDELMALCDELEARLTQQQTDADRLTEAMIAGVLEGARSGAVR